MLESNNPIIKHKAGLLNLAQELGNVSKACKVMGVSRDTFYRYQHSVELGGIDALINQNCRGPNHRNRVDPAIEDAVIAYALEHPAHGQVAFRKKLYQSLDELQKDLDEWLEYYNNERTHQGKMCCGRTPMDTLLDGKRIWAEKNLTRM